MRVGRKNKLTCRWARKGSRPRAVHDQRTQSIYLFGAVCPERGAGAAFMLPAGNNGGVQYADQPRSTNSVAPFTESESDDARNTAAPLISSGRIQTSFPPKRP
jgi:hypothetical protein